jgi:sialic acid synthase SpsE
LPGGDQEVSIEPDELEKLNEFATLVHETKGDEKEVREDEASIAEWARHSIVTAKPVAQGERLTEDDITTKRPGVGIPAANFGDVIGRELTRDLAADEVLNESDLQ